MRLNSRKSAEHKEKGRIGQVRGLDLFVSNYGEVQISFPCIIFSGKKFGFQFLPILEKIHSPLNFEKKRFPIFCRGNIFAVMNKYIRRISMSCAIIASVMNCDWLLFVF